MKTSSTAVATTADAMMESHHPVLDQRRTVGMGWDATKNMWVVVEGTRNPTAQEVVTAKYEVALQSMLKHMDASLVPEVLQQDVKHAAAAAAIAAAASDPVSEVFNNGKLGVRQTIFMFLDPNSLGRCRSISKDWYCWGLQTLHDPSHVKKAFSTRNELKAAVNAYYFRHWAYTDPPAVVQGERYDPTNARHFRSFQVQSVYGAVPRKWKYAFRRRLPDRDRDDSGDDSGDDGGDGGGDDGGDGGGDDGDESM